MKSPAGQMNCARMWRRSRWWLLLSWLLSRPRRIARSQGPKIFEDIEPGGATLLNRDDPRANVLGKLAREANVEHVLGFSEHQRSTYRLIPTAFSMPTIPPLTAHIRASRGIGASARQPPHGAERAGGSWGCRPCWRRHRPRVWRLTLPAPEGRGQHRSTYGGGSCADRRATSASPASIESGARSARRHALEGDGRRIAVLGDNAGTGRAHSELRRTCQAITGTGISHVPLRRALFVKALAEVLPSDAAVVHRDRDPTISGGCSSTRCSRMT